MASNRVNRHCSSFNQADTNRDGVLDRNEFRNFLDFQNADRNRDGRVGLAEFAQVAAPNLGIHPRNAAQAFMIADQNHDGVLDQRELADFANFQRADLNRDGRVDPYEMRMFMNQNQIGNYQPVTNGQQRQHRHHRHHRRHHHNRPM